LGDFTLGYQVRAPRPPEPRTGACDRYGRTHISKAGRPLTGNRSRPPVPLRTRQRASLRKRQIGMPRPCSAGGVECGGRMSLRGHLGARIDRCRTRRSHLLRAPVHTPRSLRNSHCRAPRRPPAPR
jgi:hypothetical protein